MLRPNRSSCSSISASPVFCMRLRGASCTPHYEHNNCAKARTRFRREIEWILRNEGAAGGIRTHTPLRTRPFEGPASTVPPPPHAIDQYMRARSALRGVRRGVAVAAAAPAPGARRSNSTFQPCGSRASRTPSAGSARARSAASARPAGPRSALGWVKPLPLRLNQPGRRRQREDDQQHRQRRADRQHPTVPAPRVEGQQQIDRAT